MSGRSTVHESPLSYQISSCLQRQSSPQITVIPPKLIAMRQPLAAIGELANQEPKRGLVLVDTNRRSN